MESRMNRVLVENDQLSSGKGRCSEIPATMINIATDPPAHQGPLSLVHVQPCLLQFLLSQLPGAGLLRKGPRPKVLGDIYSASHYGATSKVLNLAAALVTIAIVITVFGLVVSGVIHLHPR